jgi:hypothetical protein
MRLLLSLVALALIFAAPTAVSAPTPPSDPVLAQGLQTCVVNGVDAGIRLWYSDRPDLAADMSAKVSNESARLGPIIDSEIVAAQTVSKRVTRYYVALYFNRSPLWIRIDRYEGRDKTFFLPLKCSVNPDEILPGYITEFYR